MGGGVPPRPSKPSDTVTGLPVKATPNQELPSIYIGKKTKWRTKLSEGFACPSAPSMGPIFAGRGRVISGRLEVDLKENKIIARSYWQYSISTLNDYLNTVFGRSS